MKYSIPLIPNKEEIPTKSLCWLLLNLGRQNPSQSSMVTAWNRQRSSTYSWIIDGYSWSWKAYECFSSPAQVIVQFRQLRAFNLLSSSKGVAVDLFCTFSLTFDLSLGFNFEKLRSLLPLKYTGSRENEGTERDTDGVGRDMSCPRKLFLDERKLRFPAEICFLRRPHAVLPMLNGVDGPGLHDFYGSCTCTLAVLCSVTQPFLSTWFPLLFACRFVESDTSVICYVCMHCFGSFSDCKLCF